LVNDISQLLSDEADSLRHKGTELQRHKVGKNNETTLSVKVLRSGESA